MVFQLSNGAYTSTQDINFVSILLSFACPFLFHFLSPFQLSYYFLCSFFPPLLLSIFTASTHTIFIFSSSCSLATLYFFWVITMIYLVAFTYKLFFALSLVLFQTLIFSSTLSLPSLPCVFLFAFFSPSCPSFW